MISTPLEISHPDDFEDLDDMQRSLICDYKALDLILLENANELFRRFMLESEENNIENLLESFKEENPNSLALRSDTIEIKQIDSEEENYWIIKDTKKNKSTMSKYITDTVNKIKKADLDSESVIYTIFGLDLIAGGHYGALVCDLKLMKVYVFDSMTGDYINGSIISGTHDIFTEIAKTIFDNKRVKDAIISKLKKSLKLHRFIKSIFKKNLDNLRDFKLKYEQVKISYILQPTGGFEDFIAPDLENIKDKDFQMEVNVQHNESQNHFCYIWSSFFCNIYLRGKMQLFRQLLFLLESLEVIPLVVIKKYIMGFIPLLEDEYNEMEHREFYEKHFPKIWSNHENKGTLEYDLYEFENKESKNIKDLLTNILKEDFKINKIQKTSDKKIKEIIKCIDDNFTDFNISEYKQIERKKYNLRPRKNTTKSISKANKNKTAKVRHN